MKVGGLALLVSGASALLASKEGKEGKAGPLAKVVSMLDAMTAKINTEMDEQAAISKQLQCWAATNKKEKSVAIEKAQNLIAANLEKITALTGEVAGLEAAAKKQAEDVAEDQEQLAKAEAEREKEAAEFKEYDLATTKAVQQLSGALTVLKKHQSLAQLSVSEKASLSTLLSKAGEEFQLSIDTQDVQRAKSFLQSEASPYSAQSGEIFGILSQMLESMNAEHAQRVADEAAAVKNFKEMRTAKREEIAAGEAMLAQTKESLATAKQNLARTKRETKETRAQLEADKAFLADVEKRSAEDAAELKDRVTQQAAELKAIAETKDILQSEESRKMLGNTVRGGAALFVQLEKEQNKIRRDVQSVLRATGSPRLIMLAAATKLAAFDKVKKAISDLIAELKQVQADEAKKRDYCIEALNSNDNEITSTENKVEDLQGKVQGLESAIEGLKKKVEETETAISETQVEVASATLGRKEENAEYQQVFSDQTVTVKILQKAKARLDAFYSAKKASLLSTEQPGGPVGLKQGGFKKSNATGVTGLLQTIIEDAEKTIALAVADEKNAQAAYEKMMMDSRAELIALEATLGATEQELADTEASLVSTKEDLGDMVKKVESLHETKKALHQDCDFLVGNFDATQASRLQEIEALQQATQILSGADI